jgi:hypothetical protein
MTHVLKEILLPPPFKHSVSNHNVAQVPSACDDCGLVSCFRQSGHLAKSELPLQKSNRLVMQQVLDPPSLQSGFSEDKSFFSDSAEVSLALGQDVEAHAEDALEEFRAPAALMLLTALGRAFLARRRGAQLRGKKGNINPRRWTKNVLD